MVSAIDDDLDLSLALKDENILRQALQDVLYTDEFSLHLQPAYLQVRFPNLYITVVLQPQTEVRIAAYRPLVLTSERMEKIKDLVLKALRVASVRYAQGQLIQAAVARGAVITGSTAIEGGRKVMLEL